MANMYQVDENERQNALRSFGKTEDTAKEDIENVKEWMKTQTHFPEVMGDIEILNFLLLNKFNMEKTKEKIDSYYTMRSKFPEMFANPKLPNMQQLFENSYVFFHLKPLNGSSRALFAKTKEPNTYNPADSLKLLFNLYEVRLHEDCIITDTLIVDMENYSLRDLLKMTPRVAYRGLSVYKNVFALRVHAVHFLNSPIYMSIWMTLFKLLIKQKIFDRIQVHRDSKVMEERFPPEVLPKEYGGRGLSEKANFVF